jgi:hypothetical protein
MKNPRNASSNRLLALHWRERIEVRVVYSIWPSPFPLPQAGEGKSWESAKKSLRSFEN